MLQPHSKEDGFLEVRHASRRHSSQEVELGDHREKVGDQVIVHLHHNVAMSF